MYPILGEPFGFPIRAFGVMVALAFTLALWFTSREARRTKLVHPDVIGDLLLWVMAGGILGARALYVIVHWDKDFAAHPLQVLAIWKGGLVSYGGFIGAFLMGYWFCRRRKIPFLELADLCMPGTMLGQATGRIGCLLVGDDYGKVAPDLPWAIRFPDNPDSLLPAELRGQPLHPTQIYMMLKAALIFAILAWLARRRQFTGQILFTALMLYPLLRSIVEIFRGDAVERGIYGSLSTAQWISIPTFLVGVIGYWVCWRRARLRPAVPPGR